MAVRMEIIFSCTQFHRSGSQVGTAGVVPLLCPHPMIASPLLGGSAGWKGRALYLWPQIRLWSEFLGPSPHPGWLFFTHMSRTWPGMARMSGFGWSSLPMPTLKMSSSNFLTMWQSQQLDFLHSGWPSLEWAFQEARSGSCQSPKAWLGNWHSISFAIFFD